MSLYNDLQTRITQLLGNYTQHLNRTKSAQLQNVITNDLGFYMLGGIAPGTYYLEVDIDDDGVVDIAVELTIVAGATSWPPYHTEGGG